MPKLQPSPSFGNILKVQRHGFTIEEARDALSRCSNDIEAALQYLGIHRTLHAEEQRRAATAAPSADNEMMPSPNDEQTMQRVPLFSLDS